MRARIRRLGVDPDRLTSRRKNAPSNQRPEEQANELEKLRNLHDKGVLSDEEYERARERLRRY
jgi:uncharacterized membrane protein